MNFKSAGREGLAGIVTDGLERDASGIRATGLLHPETPRFHKLNRRTRKMVADKILICYELTPTSFARA